MSSLFSCFGKGSSKKTGKEPKDRKNKRKSKSSQNENVTEEIPATEEQKAETQEKDRNISIPDIIEEHGAKEPQSPLIKELEEKLIERRDKVEDGEPNKKTEVEKVLNETNDGNLVIGKEISNEKVEGALNFSVECTEKKDSEQTEKTRTSFIQEVVEEKKIEQKSETTVESSSHIIQSQISSSSVVSQNSTDSEIEQMKKDFELTKEENSKLRDFISKLEQEATIDVQDMRSQIENLQTKINDLERTNRELKESENKSREEYKRLLDQQTTLETNDQEVRYVHAVKGREHILSAFDQLTKMCMFLEPRLDKIEQFQFHENNNNPINDVIPKLTKIDDDQIHLKDDVTDLVKSLQRLECRVIRLEVDEDGANENEAKDKLTESTQRINDMDKENKKLKKEIEQAKQLTDKKEKAIEKLEREKSNMSIQMSTFMKDIEKYKSKVDDLQITLGEKEAELENSCRSRAIKEEEMKMQSIKTQTMAGQVRNKEEECKKLETQLKELQSKHADAVKRLQENVQAKQNGCHSKPAVPKEIANDTQGAVVIAQRFNAELYGGLWKEAFSKLTNVCKRDEKKSLQILMDFCTEAYLHCRRIARQQLDTVCSLLQNPSASHIRGSMTRRSGSAKQSPADRLPVPLRQHVLEFRKTPSRDFVDNLYDDFLNQLDFQKSRHLRSFHMKEVNEIAPYVNKCLEISWEMVVQDPPMYLQFKVRHGTEIDTDKFSFYSRPGHVVDYLVWPAVLREENGVLLQKGIVQAVSTKP